MEVIILVLVRLVKLDYLIDSKSKEKVIFPKLA